ncbi:MAG: leucyl aminopeptidase family protein, partial [Gammaproteobacteria bacterium]|nr:leucyl aminopeptidase family protein [Gammaproteobacteria bacterium]
MTAPNGFTPPGQTIDLRPLYLVNRDGLQAWRERQSQPMAQWLMAHAFDAAPGAVLALPGGDGSLAGAVLGIGDALDPFAYAHAPYALPAGDWQVAGELDADTRRALQLGWGLGAYRYTRFREPPRAPARLQLDAIDEESAAILAACVRVRDLVNTPTEQLGPEQLEDIARDIAQAHGAQFESIVGGALLEQNFPAIHAVGRASHRAPRLLKLHWGDPGHPHVAIVGKGVCFDTGGLDLKLADGMRWMKKDMGGAAHALALAELVMARKLPLRITLLIPAVENAIGPDAFRPGDVIATRKGVHIEIDNTDAEGRVILGDALTYAAELDPVLVLD